MGKRNPYQVYRRSGSPYYFARFWDELAGRYVGGRSTRETRKGRAEARAKEMYEAGGPLPKAEDSILLDFLFSYWHDPARKVGEKYRRGALRYLETRVAHFAPVKRLRLSQLRRHHLVLLADHLRDVEKMTPHAINRAMFAVRAALRWARERNLVTAGLTDKLPKEETEENERGALTMEEVAKLIDLEVTDWRVRTAALLNCLAGLRLGEIRGLRWEDIDWEKNQIHVRHNFVDGEREAKEPKRKGRRPSRRDVGLVEPLRKQLLVAREALARLRAALPSPRRTTATDWVNTRGALVIASEHFGRPVRARTLTEGFRKMLNAVGINAEERVRRRITFHSGRHTFTTWARTVLPDFVTMRMTGHRSKSILESYSHSDVGMLQRYTRRLNEDLAGAAGGGEPEADGEEMGAG